MKPITGDIKFFEANITHQRNGKKNHFFKKRKWSYRVIFVPETIGALAFCNKNEKIVKRIDYGLVISNVGGPGKFGYKQSFEKSNFINTNLQGYIKSLIALFKQYILYNRDVINENSNPISIWILKVSADYIYTVRINKNIF